MERFKDSLKKCGLRDRTERMLLLSPGCLFGFLPPDLDKMMARVDCKACKPILDLADRISDLESTVGPLIEEFQRPTVERNRERKRKHDRWREVPLLGRFVKPFEPEPMPDHENEPWFADMKAAGQALMRLLDEAHANCPGHWCEGPEKDTSMKVVMSLMRSNHIVVSS
jgi:hypothetical protein